MSQHVRYSNLLCGVLAGGVAMDLLFYIDVSLLGLYDAKYTKIVTKGRLAKKIYELSVSKGATADSPLQMWAPTYT